MEKVLFNGTSHTSIECEVIKFSRFQFLEMPSNTRYLAELPSLLGFPALLRYSRCEIRALAYRLKVSSGA